VGLLTPSGNSPVSFDDTGVVFTSLQPSKASHMAKPKEDPAALGHASFWDQRYASASKSEENDDSKPTHEWFRTFDSLLPFFEKHLFNVRSKDDLILHLGSGDSVCMR
jgi:hypothetical protein